MNGVQDTATYVSRPYFPRDPGEVGLYVDIDEVQSADCHTYGSDRMLRVTVMEKLGQHLAARDLLKVKGELERKGHFHGVVLEEFRKGTTLALSFNNMADLVALWKLQEGGQLSSLFQPLLVDDPMLEELGLCKLTLRVRAYQDELAACREEMKKRAKENQRVDIKSRARDHGILQRVRQFQKEQNDSLLQQLREAETDFEHHLSEFLLISKQHLPNDVTSLSSFRDFQQHMAAVINSKSDFKPIQDFFHTFELLRTALTQAEADICLPLTCIPARCETEKQQALKDQMKRTCEEVKRLLDPEFDLKKVWYREWERRVLPRERSTFMGLVSLVPLVVEKITDVDDILDDYMSGFPSVF